MAIRANITLTDGAVTPINRVYFPTQSSENSIVWRDRTSAIYVGQNRLTAEQRLATRQSRATKLHWKLETPVLEQTSPSTATGIQPQPTVAYTLLGEVKLVLPDRCSLQERKDLLLQLRDLLSEAIVTAQVQDGDLVW